MRGREQPGPDNSQVRTWLGVPYATPPLDALRFRPPSPAGQLLPCCGRWLEGPDL